MPARKTIHLPQRLGCHSASPACRRREPGAIAPEAPERILAATSPSPDSAAKKKGPFRAPSLLSCPRLTG